MAKRNFIQKIWSMCYLSAGGMMVYSGLSIYRNNEKFYNNMLMPLTYSINPEISHKLALTITKFKLFPESKYKDPAVLSTKFLGKELSNPIGIAAGFDKQGEAVEGLYRLGFGFVEIGSITPEPQPGNPQPRVFRLVEDKAIINRYGFNSDGHTKVHERLTHAVNENSSSRMLGINLGKNKNSEDPINDYVSGIKLFGTVADYVVINISSPNTPGLRGFQEKDNLKELLATLISTRNSLTGVKKALLLLKLAPDLTAKDKSDIAEVLNRKECRVDGLIISNTTIQRPDLQNKDLAAEEGGLSGQPLKNMSTEMIRDMFKLTKGSIPIIGVGGVFNGKDAYEKILAGASVVQIYSSFIYGGPPVITKIKNELSEYLMNNGFKNVNEAVGKEHKP